MALIVEFALTAITSCATLKVSITLSCDRLTFTASYVTVVLLLLFPTFVLMSLLSICCDKGKDRLGVLLCRDFDRVLLFGLFCEVWTDCIDVRDGARGVRYWVDFTETGRDRFLLFLLFAISSLRSSLLFQEIFISHSGRSSSYCYCYYTLCVALSLLSLSSSLMYISVVYKLALAVFEVLVDVNVYLFILILHDFRCLGCKS